MKTYTIELTDIQVKIIEMALLEFTVPESDLYKDQYDELDYKVTQLGLDTYAEEHKHQVEPCTKCNSYEIEILNVCEKGKYLGKLKTCKACGYCLPID